MFRRIRKWILFVASVATLQALSQSRYLQFYSDQITGQVWIHNFKVLDDDLLVFGEFEGSIVIGDSTFVKSSDQFFLTRLSSSGNLIWFKSFGSHGVLYPNVVKFNSSGSTYIGGYYSDSLWFGSHRQYSASGDPFLWHIGASGNLRNSASIRNFPETLFVRDIVSLNNYVMVLLSAKDSLRVDSGIIIRAQKDGNTINALVDLDSNLNYVNHNSFETSKGGFLMTGIYNSGQIVVASTRGVQDTLRLNNTNLQSALKAGADIMMFDSSLSLISHSYIETDTSIAPFFRIKDYSKNGDILFCGSYASDLIFDTKSIGHSNYPGNRFVLSDGFSFATNGNLKPNWLIGISSSIPNNNSTRDGIFLDNKVIIIATLTRGEVQINLSDSIAYVPLGNESIVLVLDSLGEFNNFILSESIGPLPNTRLNAIEAIGNGFAVAGHTGSEVSFTNSTDTLFRRSSRVGFIWFFDSYLDLEKFQSRQQALSLYPNPSRHWVELKIDLAQAEELLVEMLSLDGKAQRQLQHFSTEGQVGENLLRYSTSHLVPGLYLLRVRNQQGAVLGQEKLVVH